MDPLKLLLDSAGPSGVAVLAMFGLLLSGQLALGREVHRERELFSFLIDVQEKQAGQLDELIRLAREHRV